MKSEADAERLGRQYLDLARDMKVSSTEIAIGAVEYYRQGLPDAEVAKRLENTIRYAKIGGLQFKEAAEIVTAATNAMEVEAQRAVDVFTYLGDASASGVDEVGVAMQRASSSAKEAGVSFEWLGSMVATILEKTRLAPESVGTSLNAMFSRYQQMTTKGYNEEDETKINDIAKALSVVNIEIMDGEKNWKAFTDVLLELAPVWDTLDGKTKSYVTTAMAGTRQRDRLLALLNDMALGAENGSRTLELYTGALNAAGTAEEKYAIYMQSTQAAQDGMQASLETLYSTVLSGNAVKGFYNTMGGIVDVFTAGLTVFDGWLVKIPLIVGGFQALFVVLGKVGPAFLAIFKGGMTLGGLGALVAVIAAVSGAIALLSGKAKEVTKTFEEATASIEGIKSKYETNIQNVQTLKTRYEELTAQARRTTAEETELEDIMLRLAQASPQLRGAIMDTTGAYREQTEVVSALGDELVRLENEQNRLLRLEAVDLFAAASGDTQSFQSQMMSIDAIDKILVRASEAQQTVWDYVNSLDDAGKTKRMLTSGLESLAESMQIDIPWGHFWNEGSVDAALHRYSYLADSLFSQMEADTQARIGEMKNSLFAFVMQDGFGTLNESMQSYLMNAANNMIEGIDWNIWDQGHGKEVLGAELQQLYYNTVAQLEQLQPMVDRLEELARTDTSVLPEADMEAYTLEVNELTVALNALLTALGLPLYTFPEYSDVMLAAADATETLTEQTYELSEAQSKLVQQAQDIVNAMHADEAALAGYKTQLQDFQAAAQDNNLLDYWGRLTDEMQSGMLKIYPELANVVAALDDGELSAEEMAQAVDHLSTAMEKMNQNAMQASFDKYKDAGSMVSSINDALEKLSGKSGKDIFHFSDLDALVGKYPELLTMMDSQAQLEQYLTTLKHQQANAQADAYANMLLNSETYYEYLKTSNDSLYQMLTQLYGQDAENFKSLADAKAKIDEVLIANLGKAWQSHFSTLGSAMSAAAAAANKQISTAKSEMNKLRSMAGTGVPQAGMGDYNKMLKQQISDAEASLSALNGFKDIANALDGLSSKLSSVSFAAPKISAGSGGTKGGGGGKGGSSNSEMEKAVDLLQQMLDLMNQMDAIRAFERELNQLNGTYYKNRGELTNYTHALRDELTLVAKSNAIETENARALERQMDAKKAEIASLQYGTEEYDQANEALSKLQSAHQKYSKTLLQNKIDMDALTEAIKEQERAIRQMHIDVQNLVERAIRDREALYESMLKAEISLEDEILAILKRRYEKERDLILDGINERIKALQAEKRAIDDNLRKRKEENDWAKKEARLRELEEQYARISADPTRQREALGIHKEITSLREELAWQLADNEAQAQKDAIDEQIKSLQDYIDYVKKNYEELFAYPEGLIAEMRRIMEMTDAEIIAWLQANDQNYAVSSKRTQENMARIWQNTLREMRGQIVSYWDEVEMIIAQGDQAIISFLMQHSADYRAAGRMQAEAYVDEWQRKLDQLRAAAQNTYQAVQSYSYQPTYTGTYTGSSSSSSGSSSGNKSSGGGSSAKYKFVSYGVTYGPYSSMAAAERGKEAEINKIKKNAPTGSSMYGQAISGIKAATIVRYAKGGLVDYTGLAMVHGNEKNPEAFLSADQTRLIQSLVDAMQTLVQVRPFTQTRVDVPQGADQGMTITFGDLHIHVDKLESEADFEELTERVKRSIAAALKNGKAVGGMFFGR